ncbi:MAG: MobQ family relaxase [Micavibrio sp.]
MAIYHCSVRVFSRAEGHSAVAAAAYRAGAILHDERRCVTHRYHQRTGVVETFIMAPAFAPEHTHDRALLWNAAEAAETRKNARVAREVILALPHELDLSARKILARDMAAYLVERYRVVVDVALHSPYGKDGHDPRNHHAHLLFTTREVTKDGLGKKTRILDDKEHGPQEIEAIRAVWEALANAALEQAGIESRIDRRTLMDQGIDRIPEIHIGPEGKAGAAERQSRSRDEDREDNGEDEEGSRSSSSGGSGSTGGQNLGPSSEDENEDTDDEGRSETQSGTQSGKQGSGDSKSLSPAAAKETSQAESLSDEPEAGEDHPLLMEEDSILEPEAPERLADKGRKPDYPAIEQKLSDPPLTRAELVAEIKRINHRRTQRPPEPLPLQIARLEAEAIKLDRKVKRYERLLNQTSLPQALMHMIKEAIILSKIFIAERLQGQARTSFSQEERNTRAQRQMARYGQSYRLGIHEQMREMKDNLHKLETTTTHLRHYRALVERIEKELKTLPSLSFRQEAAPAGATIPPANPIVFKEKCITNAEVILKTTLKAELLREQLPPVFKPEHLKSGLLREGFKANSVITEVAQISAPFKAVTIKADNQAATIATQPSWKIKAPQEIKDITAHIQSRYEERAQRQSWFIPATDKLKTLQESIDAQLLNAKEQTANKQEVRAEGLGAATSTQTTFNAYSHNEPINRQARNNDAIDKLKAEAQKLRDIVPEIFRKEAYKGQEIEVLNSATPAPAESKRPTMASAFNKTAEGLLKQQEVSPLVSQDIFESFDPS